MKVSGAKVLKHRAALTAAARRLVQELGFDRAGVAEISREAGLTQGALYCQFGSKDGLAAAALREAFREGVAQSDALGGGAEALLAHVETYLSQSHVKDVGTGCLIAACVSDVRRQGDAVGMAFAEGVAALVDSIAKALAQTVPAEEARRRSLALLAGMAGAVAIARALEPADAALAEEVLAASRLSLCALVQAPSS